MAGSFGENSDNIGSALVLFVQLFQGVGRVDLSPWCPRKGPRALNWTATL